MINLPWIHGSVSISVIQRKGKNAWDAILEWARNRYLEEESLDELIDAPPLVIPFRTPEAPPMLKSSLDLVNAIARRSSFRDELAAEKWARKQLAKHSNYSWGFVIQTRDKGTHPWYVRFMDK